MHGKSIQSYRLVKEKEYEEEEELVKISPKWRRDRQADKLLAPSMNRDRIRELWLWNRICSLLVLCLPYSTSPSGEYIWTSLRFLQYKACEYIFYAGIENL